MRHIIDNLESSSNAFDKEQIKTKYWDVVFFEGVILKMLF